MNHKLVRLRSTVCSNSHSWKEAGAMDYTTVTCKDERAVFVLISVTPHCSCSASVEKER